MKYHNLTYFAKYEINALKKNKVTNFKKMEGSVSLDDKNKPPKNMFLNL